MNLEESDFDERTDYENFDANLAFLNKTGILSKEKNLEIGSGTGRLLSFFYEKAYDIKGIECNRCNYGKSL